MAFKERDYNADIQAVAEKNRKLKAQKVTQLGELVQLVGADSFPLAALAGVLLASVEASKGNDGAGKIARWSERGQAFFQERAGKRGHKQSVAEAGSATPKEHGSD